MSGWCAFLACALCAACAPLPTADVAAFLSLKESREQGLVMQKWEASCAAASLATVLAFNFGDTVGEQAVAEDMLRHADPARVKARGGFSLLDMKGFVERRGLRAVALRKLALDELNAYHAPIVAVRRHGIGHYVVFRGMRGERVWIGDPAFGNRELDIKEFRDMWIDGLAFVITGAVR